MCCYQESEYTDTYVVTNYKNKSSIQNGAQIKSFYMRHEGTEGKYRKYSNSPTQSHHQ
jgi:hypothetical protein